MKNLVLLISLLLFASTLYSEPFCEPGLQTFCGTVNLGTADKPNRIPIWACMYRAPGKDQRGNSKSGEFKKLKIDNSMISIDPKEPSQVRITANNKKLLVRLISLSDIRDTDLTVSVIKVEKNEDGKDEEFFDNLAIITSRDRDNYGAFCNHAPDIRFFENYEFDCPISKNECKKCKLNATVVENTITNVEEVYDRYASGTYKINPLQFDYFNSMFMKNSDFRSETTMCTQKVSIQTEKKLTAK
ncbi:MAG: hypothetical protein NTY22_06790 [Proteobacteria bacterium]|nr:hypothetical protein [Pseudomonadota bacterium]